MTRSIDPGPGCFPDTHKVDSTSRQMQASLQLRLPFVVLRTNTGLTLDALPGVDAAQAAAPAFPPKGRGFFVFANPGAYGVHSSGLGRPGRMRPVRALPTLRSWRAWAC